MIVLVIAVFVLFLGLLVVAARPTRIEKYANQRLSELLESEHWDSAVSRIHPPGVEGYDPEFRFYRSLDGTTCAFTVCGLQVWWSAECGVYVNMTSSTGESHYVHRIKASYVKAVKANFLRTWPDLTPPKAKLRRKQLSTEEFIADRESARKRLGC